jgi:hypothetical protein
MTSVPFTHQTEAAFDPIASTLTRDGVEVPIVRILTGSLATV